MVMKLEVQDGEYSYEAGKILFERVSFSVQAGEILTILGPNGVGKTTLLKCTISLLKWARGKTLVDGMPLGSLSEKQIWQKIGYVPQGSGVVFAYKVLDMVLMGRTPHLGWFSLPARTDVSIARQAMETVGITHLQDRPCAEISGGEMQLVLIARALASQPEVMVLDEPESHLDLKNQLVILGVLEKLARESGLSCIINTHYPDHALRISDKTLLLARDKSYIFGKTSDVITEETLRSFFGLDVKIVAVNTGNKLIKAIVPVAV